MNVICAIVPRFLVALARRDEPRLGKRPVLISHGSETRASVLACSGEAARAGVQVGMLLTRALVLSPSAAVVPLREEQLEVAERDYLAVLSDLCPAVEQVEAGHIHADVRGMAKLVGVTPAEYLAQLQEAIAGRTGLPVQVGGAATVFAAHAVAGYLARPAFFASGPGLAALLGPLPIEALPVSVAMLQRLHLFGLERLEQLSLLAPAALQAQFGREGLLAWRLVHGEDTDRIIPAREEISVAERLTLPSPAVLSATLMLGTDILLQRALHRQEVDGHPVRRVDWTAELENEERTPLRFVFREPTAEGARMLFVIRSGVERLALAAPAIALELSLSGICSEYARQERLWRSGPRAQAALGDAIEQLNTRGGGSQVYRVVEVEPWSRIPERQRALQAFSP